MTRERLVRAGVVAADNREHAVVRTWRGSRALCGAGRILVQLEAVFNPSRFRACEQCAQQMQRRSAPDEGDRS